MAGCAAAETISSCAEKDRLLRALHVATVDYTRAATVLQECVGVMKKEDYSRIRNYVEEVRIKVEDTRRAVERHASEHGC